jgi:uncharacterized protein YecE (DUF72 family)
VIYTGTSGFQYPEWKGTFYPPDLSAAKMLPYYAERFTTTEINYSFYRIPSAKTLTAWSAATPDQFQFSFKAPQQITHRQKLRNTEGLVSAFNEILGTMNRKLGVVLYQLPPFLKKDLPLLKDFLGSLPENSRSAFEFRHASWLDDSVFDCLKSSDVALCIADTEKLSTPVVLTAKHAYFRLRREDYSKRDLERWAKIIVGEKQRREDIHVYFKHEETGVGPKFAAQMSQMLD